jgi:very-short-patch-repair endonuclease
MSRVESHRNLTDLSRRLRRNETTQERILWSRLRSGDLEAKFRRQCPIDDYVVDFVCLRSHLVVEVDGDTHAGEAAEAEDRQRAGRLAARGLRVIRFTNRQVMQDLPGVLEAIRSELDAPSPPPSPYGRGG